MIDSPFQKPLKSVALLTDGIYPYVIGGMQRHSYYLVKYLAQHQVRVDLYHTSTDGKYDINKLEFFTDEERKNIRPFVIQFPKSGSLPGHYIRESYQYAIKVFEQLKNNLGIDFIYVKGFAGWKVIEEKQKGLKLPPVGLKFHGLEMFQPAPNFKAKIAQYFFRPATLYNLKNADYVFSYGGKITELLLASKITKEKIIEIPTGISREWLLKRSENVSVKKKLRFIFLGRYERRKGIEELNNVIHNLIKRGDFEFHFIGPIPKNKQIIAPQIKYWGAITDKNQLQNSISQADVLVCPSISEGMPNVILEGMALGLAVIATDVGAVSELVSSKNGWLIKPGSVTEIEQAILAAIALKPNEMAEKKRHSQRAIENKFLWENIITQTIRKIEKVI